MQSAQVCPKELSIRGLVTQDQDDGKKGKNKQASKRGEVPSTSLLREG